MAEEYSGFGRYIELKKIAEMLGGGTYRIIIKNKIITTKMKNATVQMFIGEDFLWYFQLRSDTGEIIYVSNAYHTEQMCLDGISQVKENVSVDFV